jgi:hypothetical protein
MCTENEFEKVSLLKLGTVFKNVSHMNPREEWESILFHPDSIRKSGFSRRGVVVICSACGGNITHVRMY